ncbi:LuxR family transcriptional regulator [Virgisporangium aliadipatigenens]|uniref:LuxR family transcriptional regulator n=1 Tax=Virgisporangium aliadipatigenens TaxID=741659 RepID=A0A8J3YV01_9ACTN|nr:helix-turn-helix transcriptional regulator [Virgisporangium aliadipatigenens]GIJ50301.1 LuxR family transcriptional regulator [Virgisporangium aliadipatigenens]
MLYGRTDECAAVDALLAGAVEGRSGALVLRGEAGIGKSALLAYAAAQAGDATQAGNAARAGEGKQWKILRGTGIESESEFPFAAVHQLLRPVADLIDAVPERPGAALRGAFGLGPAGGGDRFLISLGVLSVLAEAAESGPVLCLVDDAHWLDGASAGALTFVARRLDAEGVVMLFAARDGDPATFAAPGLPELTLAGLDAPAAGALLAARSTVELPGSVRDSLVASTAGNPLALLELPGSLSGAQLSGREPLPRRLPVGADVEQVFLDRVRRQDPATQTLLLVAAAEETGDPGVVLRAASALGVAAGALDAAERAGLIRVNDRSIAFCHPLVRTAVYRGATFWQRREAQRALADVLAGADEDRRAWHLAAAALGPDEEVAALLHDSAERARARGGHAAAATAFERAAALTLEAQRRGERLADAADAAWQAGLPERAKSLVDGAAELASTVPLRARVAHLRGSIAAVSGELTAAYATLVAAAEPIATTEPARAAAMLTEAGQSAWLAGDVRGLHAVATRLAALPHTAPPSAPPAAAPNEQTAAAHSGPTGGAAQAAVPMSAELILGLDRLLSGDTARAVGHLREVAARATQSPDLRAVMLTAAGSMFLGDDSVALGLFSTGVARARSAGAAAVLPALLAPLSSLEAWTGRFAAATANATEGLRIAHDTGQENPGAHLHAVLSWINAVHGREGECRAHAEAAISRAIGHRLGPSAGIAGWALALLDLACRRPDEARDRLAALAEAGPGDSHPVVAIFSAADLVEAAVRTDRLDLAHHAVERLASWAGHTGSVWGAALVARGKGLLAEGSAADRHFTEALALHTRGGRPFDAARTALLYGEVLRRRRRRADARVHLRTAHETFERLGLRPWADLAGTELRATGETARKRRPDTATALTPQEVQIVRIVGEGATNREVAAQLFLSPRTVDYHLRKVFAKLGVTSRAELILAARADR